MVFIEKRGEKWQKRSIWINGSMRGVPLLGRLFGKRSYFSSEDGGYEVEEHAIRYKGKCYVYKEIVTLIEEIDDPTNKRGEESDKD